VHNPIVHVEGTVVNEMASQANDQRAATDAIPNVRKGPQKSPAMLAVLERRRIRLEREEAKENERLANEPPLMLGWRQFPLNVSAGELTIEGRPLVITEVRAGVCLTPCQGCSCLTLLLTLRCIVLPHRPRHQRACLHHQCIG
jgi:hypothetical protein